MVIIMMSSSCVKRRLAEAGKWVSHKSDNTETDGDRQREGDKKIRNRRRQCRLSLAGSRYVTEDMGKGPIKTFVKRWNIFACGLVET